MSEVEERAPARQTCTDHCRTCLRHFHGIGAFDAHRQNGQCMPPAGAVSGKGRLLLQMWTTEGYCDREKGCWKDGKRVTWLHPVEIWQVAMSEEQRERLAGLHD